MSAKTALKLFAQRKFLPLFVLFQAGTLNDNILKNALIALVTYGGMVLFSRDMPPEILVATAALLFTFTFLLLCTIAGQIADKIDRGIILKWVKRAEVAIMVIAALGFLLESTAILAVSLSLMGAQSAFFSPTKNAVLPQWLRDEDLITANGLLSGFQFFFILLGMVLGIFLVLKPSGPMIVSGLLLLFALIGWIAGERVPAAPAPEPELKIDWNPITSIIGVLKTSLAHMPVFRPMLGIAWFYGFSNILVLVLPVYVADVLKYDSTVLTAILVTSTLSILVGALLCAVISRKKESMGLVAIGIIGVMLFTADIYFHSSVSTRTALGNFADFKADPATPRFLLAIMGSALCAGLYVVPLQAMAQRRSPPEVRARLMSAGAVLLNASVNFVTFLLIGLGFTRMKPETPFLAVVIISAVVTAYVLYRLLQIRKAGALAP